ncbi:MAG: efflux RND transporter periplasmic adaptor subunit [Alistipes sp.]|nr:efflux RND transporter periplasmic adaptor subunit [Alistipes sp.]
MKKNRIFRALLVSGASLALVACGSNKEAQTTEEVVVVKPKVTTEVVHIEDVEMVATFTGNAEGYAVNNITPQQPRRIKRLLVDVGDRVSVGQKVAELDDSSLAQAKAQYETAKSAFDRSDELYKFGGESKAAWEATKTNYEVAKLTYENLLENTTLLSPIAGLITARNYDNGDMVSGQPIFVVQRINPIKVFVNVSESLYAYIKRNMAVSVEFDALPEQKFEGKISRVNPSIDAATRTFEVEVMIQNNREQIKPGMFGRVTAVYGKRKNVLVPDQAVVKMLGSGDRFIYVYNEDGTVSYKKVELGLRMGYKYEVLSGVNDGDEVVVSGQVALKDGVAVELINE